VPYCPKTNQILIIFGLYKLADKYVYINIYGWNIVMYVYNILMCVVLIKYYYF